MTTEARDAQLDAPLLDDARERFARMRLQHVVERDDSLAESRTRRSPAAQELELADAARRAEAIVTEALSSEALIEVDGTAIPFAVVEHEGNWSAAADTGAEIITIAARGVPPTAVALQQLANRGPSSDKRSAGRQ